MNSINNRIGIVLLSENDLVEYGDQVGGGNWDNFAFGAMVVGGFLVYRFGTVFDSFVAGAGLNTLALIVGEACSGFTRVCANLIIVAARNVAERQGNARRYNFWDNMHNDILYGAALSTVSTRIQSGAYGIPV